MKPQRIKFYTTHKPWRTTKSRNLVALGEVKLFEDNLVSKSGLKAKHLRLLLNDFSIIVPVLERARLIFEWNYRHPLGGWELELPAGLIEDGEEPLDCAKSQRGKAHREMEEMMRVQVLRVAEAYRLLRAGAIVHAPTVVALAFAKKYLQE